MGVNCPPSELQEVEFRLSALIDSDLAWVNGPYNLYCVGEDVKHCSLTHVRAVNKADTIMLTFSSAL